MRLSTLALLSVLPLCSEPVLWYSSPADEWVEALPVGNGRLGGMVFGLTGNERIQLNEDTLWAGAPQERDIAGAFRHLPEIRKMLFDGKYVEAERMIEETIMGERIFPKGYQTLGDLWIDSPHSPNPASYRRELDLETGIARTEWTEGGVRYVREVFSSVPHDVLVVRIEANQPGAISTSVRIDRPVDATTTAVGGGLLMQGRASHEGQQLGVRFEARLRADTEGGSARVDGKSLRISAADAVTLILAAATDYRGQKPSNETTARLEAAADAGFAELRASHVADHRAIFTLPAALSNIKCGPRFQFPSARVPSGPLPTNRRHPARPSQRFQQALCRRRCRGLRPRHVFLPVPLLPRLPAALVRQSARSNCHALFGVSKIPSDNHMRAR